MLTGTAFGLLCGALLGMRFRVAILVPAHAIAMVVLAFLAANGDWSTRRLILGALAWSLGCQAGYLAGAMARSLRPADLRQASPIRRAKS